MHVWHWCSGSLGGLIVEVFGLEVIIGVDEMIFIEKHDS
jgi:hypothetical protein